MRPSKQQNKFPYLKLTHHTDHTVIIIWVWMQKGHSSNYLWCNNRIFTTNHMVGVSILLHGLSGFVKELYASSHVFWNLSHVNLQMVWKRMANITTLLYKETVTMAANTTGPYWANHMRRHRKLLEWLCGGWSLIWKLCVCLHTVQIALWEANANLARFSPLLLLPRPPIWARHAFAIHLIFLLLVYINLWYSLSLKDDHRL